MLRDFKLIVMKLAGQFVKYAPIPRNGLPFVDAIGMSAKLSTCIAIAPFIPTSRLLYSSFFLVRTS
jgi:hypothetical protein